MLLVDLDRRAPCRQGGRWRGLCGSYRGIGRPEACPRAGLLCWRKLNERVDDGVVGLYLSIGMCSRCAAV